jgi:hypothetical protein
VAAELLSPIGHFGVLVPLATLGAVDHVARSPAALADDGHAGGRTRSASSCSSCSPANRFPHRPFLLILAAGGLASSRAWLPITRPHLVAGGIALAALSRRRQHSDASVRAHARDFRDESWRRIARGWPHGGSDRAIREGDRATARLPCRRTTISASRCGAAGARRVDSHYERGFGRPESPPSCTTTWPMR